MNGGNQLCPQRAPSSPGQELFDSQGGATQRADLRSPRLVPRGRSPVENQDCQKGHVAVILATHEDSLEGKEDASFHGQDTALQPPAEVGLVHDASLATKEGGVTLVEQTIFGGQCFM